MIRTLETSDWVLERVKSGQRRGMRRAHAWARLLPNSRVHALHTLRAQRDRRSSEHSVQVPARRRGLAAEEAFAEEPEAVT